MFANLLDELGSRLTNTRDAAQHHPAHLRRLPPTDRHGTHAQRMQTHQHASELLRMVCRAGKQHRGWLTGRRLHAQKQQIICELRYAVLGDGHYDRGVRFQIDLEEDTLTVWWLPQPVFDGGEGDTEIVIVGGPFVDAMLRARLAEIDFSATIASIVRTMIDLNPNWHTGQRPRVLPVPKAPTSQIDAAPAEHGTHRVWAGCMRLLKRHPGER